MAKEELIQFEGLVTEILPDARYRVQLDAGHPRRRTGGLATSCAEPGRTVRTARPRRQNPGIQGT